MSLTAYKSKRNIEKSGEPEAEIKSSKKGNIFVIQEHNASHLHWDLRLEMEGVLKSWALPKSPPEDTKTKRLAIQVEDHPLDYATFHGEIKEGYGKGIVKIYDKGTYELLKKNSKEIEINIHGKKLKGRYVLIKTGYVKNGWLFMKI